MLRWALLAALVSVPARAFIRSTVPGTTTPLQWITNCISFRIHSKGYRALPFEDVEVEVVRSAQQWMLPACTDLSLRYRGLTNDGRVGFFRDEPNENIVVFREGRIPGDDWVHDTRTLALTTNTFCTEVGGGCPFVGAVIDSDIEVNAISFSFTNDAEAPVPTSCEPIEGATSFDLGNTLTHEFGHLVGLDHVVDLEATMFAESLPGERCKRDLSADDAAGICAIFPTRSDGPACLDLRPRRPADDCAAAPGGGSGLGGLWLLAWAVYRRRR